MIEVGRRIVHKDGRAAIYLGQEIDYSDYSEFKKAETASRVYVLTSGQLEYWSNASWTEDISSSHAQAVLVLNAIPVKISTIFWGVILAHLVLGAVVGLVLILLH